MGLPSSPRVGAGRPNGPADAPRLIGSHMARGLLAVAKVGILAASIVAGVGGYLVLRRIEPSR